MLYTIHRLEIRRLNLLAQRAKNHGGREVCGLLLNLSGPALTFFVLRNESPQAGTFCIGSRAIEGLEAFCLQRGGRIVAAFHSHPISEASPGDRDVANAFYNSHALIYDVIGKEARVWCKAESGVREVEAQVNVDPDLRGYELA